MEIRIYFEGNKALRGGFESFFAELRTSARESGSPVELIAAKDGPAVYRKAERTHPEAWNILLKDSEGPAPTQLQKHVFWMVELMEAWFLADPDSLGRSTEGIFDRMLLATPRMSRECRKQKCWIG